MSACREIERLLDELVDGTLDDARARAVRGHLRTCLPCARRSEDLVALVEAASQLGRVDPPSHLWEQIGVALDQEAVRESRRPRLWWLWHAWRRQFLAGGATVALAAALLLLVMARAQQPLGAALRALPAPPATPDELYEQAVRDVEHAEDDYVAAVSELRDLVVVERPHWSPAVARAFDENLAVIDAAVARQAELARRAPGNPEIADALHASYRREIDFLQEAVVRGQVP